MPTPEFLRDLPSVKELLEHPQLKSVADRLNRSVVATRVRGYLDELRDEVQKRSANLPSMREIAQSVSRYVLRGDGRSIGAAINATGRFRGGPWGSAPLSEAAIERVMLSAPDYLVGEKGATDSLALTLCLMTGAGAATVFNSRTGALWLALEVCAKGRKVIVGRSDLTVIDPGCRVTDLFATLSSELCEVGAVDGVTVADYAAAIDGATNVILRVTAEEHRLVGSGARPSVGELAQLAKDRGVLLIEDLGSAPLMDPPQVNDQPVVTIEGYTAATAIADGADLVLVRGDGLVGGPACEIVIGAADLVDPMQAQPLASAYQANPRVVAGLAATCEVLADQRRAAFDLPIWSLLSTPLENLRTRAERLAPQLVASPHVSSAEVVTLSAEEAPVAGVPVCGESVAVALSPAGGDVSKLEAHLQAASLAVFGRKVSDRLLLDLRTVMPRQDLQLLDAFVPDNSHNADILA